MNFIVIILGLAILLILTLKKLDVTISSLIAVVFIIALSRLPILQTVNENYLTTFVSFIQNSWLMLLLGGLLSKLIDISGAARSIAQLIIGRLGEKRAIPSIIIAGGLLTYGGVMSMVSCFALYPIALAIFRKANLPRYLIPAVIGSGIFTWVNMLPGNPSIINIIPTKYLSTTAMASPSIGVICALFTLLLTLVYFSWEVKKAKVSNKGFEADEHVNEVLKKADELEASGKLPNPWISLLPLVSIAVTLNVFKMDITIALCVGILLSFLCFYRTIFSSTLLEELTIAANSAAKVAIQAGAIVGIGGVIKVTPGLQQAVDYVMKTGSSGINPILIFGIATTILCGLNASGMGGLSTTLSVLGEPFMKMGVNPSILHRVGVIASTGLDSLPHSGGIVAVLAISGISYKEGYKYLFITTVVITLIALVLAIGLGMVMYPIA